MRKRLCSICALCNNSNASAALLYRRRSRRRNFLDRLDSATPIHSSSTANRRCASGKVSWFLGDHGSLACLSSAAEAADYATFVKVPCAGGGVWRDALGKHLGFHPLTQRAAYMPISHRYQSRFSPGWGMEPGRDVPCARGGEKSSSLCCSAWWALKRPHPRKMRPRTRPACECESL